MIGIYTKTEIKDFNSHKGPTCDCLYASVICNRYGSSGKKKSSLIAANNYAMTEMSGRNSWMSKKGLLGQNPN